MEGIKTLALDLFKNGNNQEVTKDLVFSLGQLQDIEQKKDVYSLLTIAFSYYLNGEKLANKTKLQKVLYKIFKKLNLEKILDLEALKKYNSYGDNHLKYIIKHFILHVEILKKWVSFDYEECNIQKILIEINDLIYKGKGFRKKLVVHQMNRLNPKRKARKHSVEKAEIMNSKFIFPPNDYIQPLLESLNNKIKDPNIDFIKKSAYLHAYTFLTHPFEDGNSRASRTMATTFLEHNGFKFMRLYTFVKETQKNIPSYMDFLEEIIYNEYLKRIKPYIELDYDEDGEIIISKYLSLNDYEKFIEEMTVHYYKLIKSIIKFINLYINNINYLISFIIQLSKLGYKENSPQAYITNKLFFMLTHQQIDFSKQILPQICNIKASRNANRKYNITQEQIDEMILVCHKKIK